MFQLQPLSPPMWKLPPSSKLGVWCSPNKARQLTACRDAARRS